MSLGARITAKRKELGLTQEQLAEKLSVTRQTLGKWENGLSKPDVDSLQKMASLFNMTIDELLKEDEAPVAAPTNDKKPHVFGILSIVLGALGLVPGLVFGIVGHHLSKDKKNKTLNKIGIIVSGVCLVIYTIGGAIGGYYLGKYLAQQTHYSDSGTSDSDSQSGNTKTSATSSEPEFVSPDGGTLSERIGSSDGRVYYYSVQVTLRNPKIINGGGPYTYLGKNPIFLNGGTGDVEIYDSYNDLDATDSVAAIGNLKHLLANRITDVVAPRLDTRYFSAYDFGQVVYKEAKAAAALYPTDFAHKGPDLTQPGLHYVYSERVSQDGYYLCEITTDTTYKYQVDYTCYEYAFPANSTQYTRTKLVEGNGLSLIVPGSDNCHYATAFLCDSTESEASALQILKASEDKTGLYYRDMTVNH